ncbi:MAG: carbohydrate kinase family protein [Salinibacter sp.]
MAPQTADVVVAGHICLDIIPEFETAPESPELLIQPGQLTEVGEAVMAPGGAVSNIGLALHRLGLSTQLIGKVGDDLIGEATVDHLQRLDGQLADGIVQAEGKASSYTIVLSPPGFERVFFHSPGPNDTFRPQEVSPEDLPDARFFYFGYPPLLREVYRDGGEQLAALFRDVQAQGLGVAMDMTVPDPDSESGQVDWAAWLTRVLPHVDLFAPSLEEILYMIDRPLYEEILEGTGDFSEHVGTGVLERVAGDLIGRGVPIVALKLGAQGLYLRTADDWNSSRRLDDRCGLSADQWSDRQLLLPAFETDVVGTTGAGDAAVAGFLMGLHRGLSPEATLKGAVAVGSFSVEVADASSGIPDWETVQARLDSGWEQAPLKIDHSSWQWGEEQALWVGPEDQRSEVFA